MFDFSLLKALLNKATFEKYSGYVSSFSNRELQKIFYSIRELYRGNTKDSYTTEELALCFYASYPSLKDSEKDLFSILFKKIEDADADPTLVEKYLRSLKQKETARQIAILALDVSEGRAAIESLHESLNGLEVGEGIEEEIEFVTSDLNELYENHVKKPGLRWRLKSLNESLGSLRKDDFGIVFARTETGKTSFIADQLTFMARQTNQPILWFNNEEAGQKVMRRIYSAALGKTEREIFSDLVRSKEEYLKLTNNNIFLIDEATITKDFAERVIKKLNPALVVFDVMDKIQGFTSDRNDLLLGSIYEWGRSLAKTYCPTIAVCQADGTAEGVKWLNMGHVDNAKTAKQKEADWILGIGKTNGEGMENVRFLNISKNKLSGDEDSLPEQRHGRYETILKADICRFEDC